MPINILYIDDEKNNLSAFKALFRKEFNIYLADSAEAGLKILKETEVEIIITDQRMPGFSGVQFFESILHTYPDPVRILLTAYTDVESVIDAINKGQVFRYIRKPWDEHDLKMTIENGFELFKTRKKLLERNRELKKSNDELSRFVYSASHELKAPLSTILGILKIARTDNNKTITNSSEKYFDMIQGCAYNLEALIKNIVNYHKNNSADKDTREVNFQNLISDILDIYKNNYEVSSINIKVNIEQEKIFIGDEFRIRLIISNLISNAIKYQKESEDYKYISIKIKVSHDYVNLSIEDNGIGMDNDCSPNIFNMFYRGTAQNTGTGFGLYIVKEALNKVGGEILVSSTEGIGSIFQIKIPNKPKLVLSQQAI
ncbi:MAG TPA: hybrid sensor histidine kinase/response regulator [Cytophagaceae bacterium]|jgi:two-component system sensor histidine kinase/response regulator|nr:hybrid sensor histidine kinase/response regulator [Cytophagaceae bacterium]